MLITSRFILPYHQIPLTCVNGLWMCVFVVSLSLLLMLNWKQVTFPHKFSWHNFFRHPRRYPNFIAVCATFSRLYYKAEQAVGGEMSTSIIAAGNTNRWDFQPPIHSPHTVWEAIAQYRFCSKWFWRKNTHDISIN